MKIEIIKTPTIDSPERVVSRISIAINDEDEQKNLLAQLELEKIPPNNVIFRDNNISIHVYNGEPKVSFKDEEEHQLYLEKNKIFILYQH